MSWNANGKITTIKDGPTTIEFPLDYPQTGHGAVESVLAIQNAKLAAQSLLETGVLGYGKFQVGLNGHANPDNKPSSTYVNDNVQISIRQMGESE